MSFKGRKLSPETIAKMTEGRRRAREARKKDDSLLVGTVVGVDVTEFSRRNLEQREEIEKLQTRVGQLSAENAELKKYSNGQTAENLFKLIHAAMLLAEFSPVEKLVVEKVSRELAK